MAGWALPAINNNRLYTVTQQLGGHHQTGWASADYKYRGMLTADLHTSSGMEDQENARLFMQIGHLLFPGGYALGFYHLIGSCQVTSYAKAGGRFATTQNFLEHGV